MLSSIFSEKTLDQGRKIFLRDPTSGFGYEILSPVTTDLQRSIWTLHSGKKRATGEPVSIFKCDLTASGQESYFERARAGLKRLKTLRHPCIVTYLDSIETEKVILIATEPVQTLHDYLVQLPGGNTQKSDIVNLKEQDADHAKTRQGLIGWGLHQIATGLKFLNIDCGLIHSAICINSIFVDKRGVWRIGNLDFVYPAKDTPSSSSGRPPGLAAISYIAPTAGNDRLGQAAVDSYGFGVLVWEIFNGSLSSLSSLRALNNIPSEIGPFYFKLVDQDPRQRITHQEFTTQCKQPNGFISGVFIDSMLFLEEIQIKDQGEKNRFLTNLEEHLDSFPKEICKNKILPLLIESFEFGNAGSATIGPIFRVATYLDEEEYKTKMVPCVVKLFACQDRAVRTRLLEQMDLYIQHMSKSTINDHVFTYYAQGFTDSNPIIREQTVKCIPSLAPKLNYANLNEEILKHMGRLLVLDEDGSIRTNTTIILGKIAHNVDPQVRQQVLVPAFLRVMKDPLPACRHAAIMSLCATQNYYSINETATKVMPALCHLSVDDDKSVRDVALKSLKGFITKIDMVSEDATLREQMETDLNAPGSAVNRSLNALTSNWTEWAVTSVSSKYAKFKSSSAGTKISETLGTLGASSSTNKTTSGSNTSQPSSASSTPVSNPSKSVSSQPVILPIATVNNSDVTPPLTLEPIVPKQLTPIGPAPKTRADPAIHLMESNLTAMSYSGTPKPKPSPTNHSNMATDMNSIFLPTTTSSASTSSNGFADFSTNFPNNPTKPTNIAALDSISIPGIVPRPGSANSSKIPMSQLPISMGMSLEPQRTSPILGTTANYAVGSSNTKQLSKSELDEFLN